MLLIPWTSLPARLEGPELKALSRWKTWGSGLVGAVRRRDFASTLAHFHNVFGARAFGRLARKMAEDPDGERILADRPRIDLHTFDPAVLEALPPETLGHQFQRFMRSNGFDRELHNPVGPFATDPDAEYARARWRETHDFRHVLVGLHASFPDEAVISAFQYGQVPNPWNMIITVAAAVAGIRAQSPLVTWRRSHEAWRAGRRAGPLANVYWEEHLDQSVASLRERFAVEDLSHLSTR